MTPDPLSSIPLDDGNVSQWAPMTNISSSLVPHSWPGNIPITLVPLGTRPSNCQHNKHHMYAVWCQFKDPNGVVKTINPSLGSTTSWVGCRTVEKYLEILLKLPFRRTLVDRRFDCQWPVRTSAFYWWYIERRWSWTFRWWKNPAECWKHHPPASIWILRLPPAGWCGCRRPIKDAAVWRLHPGRRFHRRRTADSAGIDGCRCCGWSADSFQHRPLPPSRLIRFLHI